MTVIGGFICPSSDEYVTGKLGRMAMTFEQRRQLCEIAVGDQEWLSVCRKGEVSSKWACRSVQREIQEFCADDLDGRTLKGIEIMGSDTIVRLFSKMLAQGKTKLSQSLLRGRTFCCVMRAGMESSVEEAYIREKICPAAADHDARVVVVEQLFADRQSGAFGSSTIRGLVSKGEWTTIEANQWLHPGVLSILKKMQQ
jgi:hypothetical protein